MSDNRVYSTAEICEMFDISKSTLFRWEREGILDPVQRDISNQRQYGQEHITAISEIQKEKLSKRYERAMTRGNANGVLKIAEAVSLRKFLEQDMTGLYELAEMRDVSGDTLKQLMKIALEEYDPDDEIFCEIVRVLWEQTRHHCQ